ncbi:MULTISPECIES: hypothetical protein [unclassified Bacillus (in: firmicutes)]|uniref:hypothetical protein n=1 Tax=unclassified Bacillus (in: firmicutes) TaxID=185979 RepID=UPI001BE710A7|nr:MULTISPECIES: hypothetical protein [unclassified Bacillus (in: firmicutes)]MBT2615083.1 hypothetical protein [Bacillus sp. ISL-78]MBT2627700.1 hypothetical protein [Bacillus sp. ISL-101]
MVYAGSDKVTDSNKFKYFTQTCILSGESLQSTNEFPVLSKALETGELLKDIDINKLAEIANIIESGGSGGGSVPSNVILYEDWTEGELVTIDSGTTAPDTPILTITPNGVFPSTESVSMTTDEKADIYYALEIEKMLGNKEID